MSDSDSVSESNWNYTVGNIRLNLWSNKNWKEDEVVQKVAMKMVENTITKSWVAKIYAIHDRSNLHSTNKISKADIKETLKHLRDVPEILSDYESWKDYGYTNNSKNPNIHLSREMILYSRRDLPDVKKFSTSFMMYVTILHELGHHKLRKKRCRQSPKKIFPSLKQKGEFIELKLFSGVITSIGGPIFPGERGLILTKKSRHGFISEYEIKEDWIQQVVVKILGDNFDEEDLIPEWKRRQKRRRLDKGDDLIPGKSGHFEDEYGNKYVV